MFKLEDFIATYPDQNDPDIQAKLSAKRELNELAPDISEKLLKRGEYYKHQTLFYRIFKHYRRSLIIDETGTGKSCLVTKFAEELKNIFKEPQRVIDELPHINKVYFIVKGPNIEQELRNQIVFKCTPEGTYDTENVLFAETSKARENAITRELKEWYDIQKFQTLANTLSKKSDAQIIDEYSGSMFFIDEAHYLKSTYNIIEDTEQGLEIKAKRAKKIIQNAEFEVKKEKGELPELANIYDQIHRLTHLVKRSYIFIATATPMINEPKEIASIMNIINPLNMQMSHNQFNWNTVTLEQLEPYFRGKISYVRSLDTGIKLNEVGETSKIYFPLLGPIPNSIENKIQELGIKEEKTEGKEENFIKSQMIIHNTVMESFQEKGYNEAYNKKHLDKKGTFVKNSFYIDQLSASNFIFPDGSWGGDFKEKIVTEGTNVRVLQHETGISKYVTSEHKDEFTATPEFKKYLSDLKNIKKSSCKYYDIIKRYTGKNANVGSAFIYGDIKSGSGLFVLSLCLEAHGFVRFTNNTSSFIYSANEKKYILKPEIKKTQRYALITGDTPPSRRRAILELFNSYENRYGEYIKLLLGSEVTQAGINFSNVLNFELVTSEWHMSAIYQALSRILRSTSHEVLLNELLARDPNAKLIVNIYRHSANTRNQYNNFLNKRFEYENIQGSGELSTDEYLYMISEDKDIRIKRIMKMLIQCSVNCIINYTRNHRVTDIDYSPTCFYDRCSYKCLDADAKLPRIVPLNKNNRWDNLSSEYIDTSTFDLYYTDELVDYLTGEIRGVIKKRGIVSVEELSMMYPKIPLRYFIITLNAIAKKRILFENGIGILGYLQVINNIVFFIIAGNEIQEQSEQSKQTEGNDKNNDFLQSYYSNNFIYTVDPNENQFMNYMIKNNVSTAGAEVNTIFESNSEEEIINSFEQLPIQQQSDLLEKAIIQNESKVDNNKNLQILYNKYKYIIYRFNEPTAAITEADNFYKHLKLVGRKDISKEFSKVVPGFNYEESKENPVIIHALYNIHGDNTNYRSAITYKKIIEKLRLYNINIGIWKDLSSSINVPEYYVYKYLIEELINKKQNQINSNFNIYGILINDVFKIKDSTTEKEGAKLNKNNLVNRGRTCTSYGKDELINIFYKLGYELDFYLNGLNETSDIQLEEMADILRSKKVKDEYFTEYDGIERTLIPEKVLYYFNFLNEARKTKDMCSMLREYMERNGMVLDVNNTEY
jgi:hypothetical protein